VTEIEKEIVNEIETANVETKIEAAAIKIEAEMTKSLPLLPTKEDLVQKTDVSTIYIQFSRLKCFIRMFSLCIVSLSLY
jgi:hypothetical protein